MLVVELDLDRITESQSAYRTQGTIEATKTARDVMTLRTAFETLARRFNERQEKARDQNRPHLEDGRASTIRDTILSPTGRDAWPNRTGALLHGLQIPVTPLLPNEPCCDGGPALPDLDAESYLAVLNDGPAEARTLDRVTALVQYLDPLCLLRIVWIGAVRDVELQTGVFLSAFAKEDARNDADLAYAKWLIDECSEALAGSD